MGISVNLKQWNSPLENIIKTEHLTSAGAQKKYLSIANKEIFCLFFFECTETTKMKKVKLL